MRRIPMTLSALFTTLACFAQDGLARQESAKQASTPQQRFERAILLEDIERDLAGAIDGYRGLVDDPSLSTSLRGDASKRLPSCVDCHGPEGKRRRPVYPDLRGQPADYLVRQLELFKDQRRGGTEFAHLMHHVAPHLSAEQMHDVAAYFASIPAEPERSAGVSDGSADVAPGGH